MALAARPPLFCQQLRSKKPSPVAAVQRSEPDVSVPVQKLPVATTTTTESGKIVLQPRLCTLRSYGSDPIGVMKTKNAGEEYGDGEVSRFFETLSEYIESSKKSQDFEIISGRLAMVVFAGTVTMEIVTGNSLFRKMEVQGIAEAAGVCLAAVTCAATFAWFSSARNGVGRIFTFGCNSFIDSLIDQIVDGLFYDTEPTDWSDEI